MTTEKSALEKLKRKYGYALDACDQGDSRYMSECLKDIMAIIPNLISVLEWARGKLSCLQHDQHTLDLQWVALNKEDREKSRNNYTNYKMQIACQISLMLELLLKLEGKKDE